MQGLTYVSCSGRWVFYHWAIREAQKKLYLMTNPILLNLNFLSKVVIGEGNGTPLQYSCLENPMDGGAWWAAVHGVTKSPTQLSDFTFTFHFHALEKEMATHSSVLAWRIPGTGEPGGLLPMGSHRVGHDWSDLAAAAAGCDNHGCPRGWWLHLSTSAFPQIRKVLKCRHFKVGFSLSQTQKVTRFES